MDSSLFSPSTTMFDEAFFFSLLSLKSPVAIEQPTQPERRERETERARMCRWCAVKNKGVVKDQQGDNEREREKKERKSVFSPSLLRLLPSSSLSQRHSLFIFFASNRFRLQHFFLSRANLVRPRSSLSVPNPLSRPISEPREHP